MTKEEYMDRPGDIDLGNKWWNEMRRRQRELNWPQYRLMCQMAQSTSIYGTGYLAGWKLSELLRGE